MRVLFVCTGNTCRSPFAAAVAQRGGSVEASSAGIHATEGLNAPDDALSAARERGVDLESHRSSLLTGEMLERADVVVGMTADHVRWLEEHGARGKARLLGRADLDDPIGCGHDTYNRVYARIEEDVRCLLEEFP